MYNCLVYRIAGVYIFPECDVGLDFRIDRELFGGPADGRNCSKEHGDAGQQDQYGFAAVPRWGGKHYINSLDSCYYFSSISQRKRLRNRF